MSFDKLLEKVEQAENAVEARERQVAADWRQARRSWTAAWSPGRIVLVGLASGFLVGRMQPGGMISGGGVLRMLASLSALMASSQAAAAAGEAEDAATAAEGTAESAAAAGPPIATAEAFEP